MSIRDIKENDYKPLPVNIDKLEEKQNTFGIFNNVNTDKPKEPVIPIIPNQNVPKQPEPTITKSPFLQNQDKPKEDFWNTFAAVNNGSTENDQQSQFMLESMTNPTEKKDNNTTTPAGIN